MSLLKKVDAVLIRVPDVESGLRFYVDQLGMQLRWKKTEAAAIKLGDCELVLSTKLDPETDILVESVPLAVAEFEKAGGNVILKPEAIDVGLVAVVKDPFGNQLTLVDLSKGLYKTDSSGNVTGVS